MVSQQNLMNKLYQLMKDEPVEPKEISLKGKQIIDLVNKEFNCNCTTNNKTSAVSDARATAMYLMSKHTKMTLLEIALAVGRGHHTTVMAGRQKVKDRMKYYPEFKQIIDKIEQQLI
jgi:chromosomal replication initiation ATPase DnaA